MTSQENGAGEDTSTEWEKYWGLVSANPDDFTSWEQLIRLAETANGGITKDSSAEDVANLKTVYDHFLAKFPLCFGYWKKFADLIMTVEGAEKAEEVCVQVLCVAVYERGVASIHNSVDLWTHFATFKIANDTETAARELLERGANAVGYDFLSHTFWDKYIEFEESKERGDNVMALLNRIIQIPLHQYTRYFERYSQLAVARPVSELVSPQELDKLEDEARRTSHEAGGAKAEEDIQAEVREKIQALKTEIYTQNQEAVHKRWVFESEIKRPYFHVKPIDDAQLANWRKYLDFEEAEGDVARCYILYERCLVSCALYEEFWLRYARYLVERGDTDGARNVYVRATTIFVAAGRTTIRLEYADFEEENGKPDDAREIYKKILEAVPGHVETIYKQAHFERRHSGFEAGEEILTKAIDEASEDKAKAFLVVAKAKYIYNVKSDAEEARSVYTEHVTKLQEQKYLVLSYFVFETSLPGKETISHAKNAWEVVKASSALTNDEKRELGYRLQDLLHDRLDEVLSARRLEKELRRNYPIETAASPPATAAATPNPGSASVDGKRKAAGEDSPYRAAKVLKTDAGQQPLPAAPQPSAHIAPVAAHPYAAYQQAGYPAYPQAGYPQAAAAAWGQYYQGQGWDYSQAQGY
ncbi:hypothetical protein HDU97_001475 [Phlyctochytrium planicorne]|nr:hypothetical protein HDU97_001475 [Phlyctochytrium planicorne]